MDRNQIEDCLKLAQEAPLFHERLHRAGLHKTAQKMHAVVQEIGYEVADKLDMVLNPPETD